MAKTLLGCAWCTKDDGDLTLCCRRHARLVCAECKSGRLYQADHPQAA